MLIHLQGDVAAADQLAVHVELRIRRPVRVALQRLAHLRLLEDVDVLELGAHRAQGRHGLGGEAALGKIRRALHEQHHGARAQLGLDSLDDIHLDLYKNCQTSSRLRSFLRTLQLFNQPPLLLQLMSASHRPISSPVRKHPAQ